MIKNLYIKNFKALKELDLKLSNINVFTGLNGMGKSTILQVLLLLRQSQNTLNKGIKLNGDLVKIGTFEEAFCEAAEGDEIVFKLELANNQIINFQTKYKIQNKKETVLPTFIYDSENENIALFGDDTFLYISTDRISPKDNYNTDNTLIKNKQLGNNGELSPHFYHVNKNNNIAIKELAFDCEDKIFSLEYQLNKWLGVISPNVNINTNLTQNLITLQFSYKTKSLNTNEFKPKNAGFGLTYVFSVLVAILSSKPGDLIIIENPESHIHPRGQSELARLLALAAKNGVQVFIETHSDHILYGLRIAIKEKEIAKEEVKVYYLDRDENEHFSKAFFIEIDDLGRIKRDVIKYFREYEHHLNRLIS